MADIFDWIDCEDCPSYEFYEGRTEGDPDSYYPGEAECSDGDFGNGHPCERMLSRIEEGLEDGDFDFPRYYLLNSRYLTGSETKEDYWDELSAWPDTDWATHPYWQIFYDKTAPAGFDTVEEVYEGVFQ
ncbi:MAG: hypothetical protein LBL31_03750 [Spirochaetaceae bacterium]|jgi:hypothetical protein|nr:hypothetical protein [Spirochaetaceae bacterium]